MALRKFGHIDFRKAGPIGVNHLITGPAFPTSAATQVDSYLCGSDLIYVGQLGNCGATLYPERVYAAAPACSGWAMPHAATNALGTEIGLTITADPNHPAVFTVGTDAAFYMSAVFSVADASDMLSCGCGFRTAGALNATVADWQLADYAAASAAPYADILGLSLQQTAADTVYNVKKVASVGAAQVSTTQTVTDATAVTFTIKVSAAGVTTAYINGALATAGSALGTITAGTLVTPYFCEQNEAATNTIVTLQSLTWSLQ